MREQGRVDWFDKELGYGFIRREEGPDVFVHWKRISKEGLKHLDAGDVVEFEVREVTRKSGGKKLQAFEVAVITPANPGDSDAVQSDEQHCSVGGRLDRSEADSFPRT